MGSPEFALPTLRALAARYPVVGVVTQPDRPAGRGRALTPPPVKQLAQSLALPVIQPRRLREPDAMEQLRAWAPELIVVAAFGQILRPEVLELPPGGCINVHASLLPRWRGAAPVQAALLHGDRQTGITIMRMDPGIDTGPILSQRAINIEPQETAGELAARLAQIGADLLIETLPAYFSGELQPTTQDDRLATYAPMLEKAEGQLDFSQPAATLACRVRAFNPWPGAFTHWQGATLKVHHARAVETAIGPEMEAGQTTILHGQPAVVTGQGWLVLEQVQLAGKKLISGKDFLQGARGWGQANLAKFNAPSPDG
jgi:methionyl-tRNA formyltransferase